MGANIRCRLGWLDCLVGMSAAVIVAILLVGFRFQSIPEYKPGDIASKEIRTLQDVTYEDTEATAQKRVIARATVPAVYVLNTRLILARESEIARAFAEARELLIRLNLPSRGPLSPAQQEEFQREFRRVSQAFSSELVPILLSQRFATVLEGRLVKLLDLLLREGVIRDTDRSEFQKHQRVGIVVFDDATSVTSPMGDTFTVRGLSAAREVLAQYQLEFAALPATSRVAILEFLSSQLFPSLVFDERETNARRDAAAAQVPPVEIQLKQGKVVLRRGEEVTREKIPQLEALRNLQRPKSLLRQFAGFCFFALVFIYTLWRYLVHHKGRNFRVRSRAQLILIIWTTVLLVTRLITELAEVLSDRLSIDAFDNPYLLDYVIPFAFGSLLITLLVDINLGLLTSIVTAILIGLFYEDIYLMSYVLLGSLAGIFSVQQYKDRAAIQKAGLTIGVVGTFTLWGIDLLRQNPISYSGLMGKSALAFASGLLTSAIASLLLPALESIFKITTDLRLLELSNLNAPLLKRLSVEAPGTYHHSLMVGTLAEPAAEAIGANPLLTRVGAYYHDLGKMFKPEYFVENQAFGMNKHENLSPSMSCLVISSHIKDGLELARQHGIAEQIRDMIPQHHGTRVMSYFYQKAKEAADPKGQEIAEVDFRYPGPKPQTKEAAIMMMADSVEAASRTLKEPTAAQIQGLIDRLVDVIVADDQLDECDITLAEIRMVKESFLKTLSSLRHQRIDYPGYDFKETSSDADRSGIQNSSSKPPKPGQD